MEKSCIYFNEAEAMVEAFWDSGDTYSNHFKFDRMKNYDLRGDGEYKIMWNGVQIYTDGHYFASREIDLDVSDFDTLSLKVCVPEGMHIIVRAKIDGVLQEVIRCEEAILCKEFEGKISGNKITYIEYEFIKVGFIPSPAVLYWLTVANSKRRDEMRKRDNGFKFPDCWEGCFNDDFEIKPHLCAFIDEEELEELRKKVNSGLVSDAFKKLEETANKYMDYEPEKEIGRYFRGNVNFLGRTENEPIKLSSDAMIALAIVGLVKKDKKMIKMACRFALSVACCEKWTEGVIGDFPGTTFHHRSFKECDLSLGCAKVLDWAGEALTWHGRNIIYDAIILKGFPRIESDIYTMDYIWTMNQGIVFTTELIESLLVIAKRYPRYEPLIDHYENVLLTMWGNYAKKDGGTSEGPAYWDYSATYVMKVLYFIAKYKKIKLEDYIPEELKATENYAKSVLSTYGDGTTLVPINDTVYDLRFALAVSTFFAMFSKNKKYWSSILKKSLDGNSELFGVDEFIIMAKDIEEVEGDVEKEGYTFLENTGMVSLARKSSDLGTSALYVQAGHSEMGGHEHEDKGTFIIEADAKRIVSDRGYRWSNKDALAYSSAKWHNLIFPELEKEAHQARCVEGHHGKFLKSEYKDGRFECEIDVSPAWEGIFEKNIRRVYSPDANLFVIHDSVKCDCDVTFRLNTYGKFNGNVIDVEGVKLYIYTLNWTPDKIVDGIEGTDANENDVNLVKLYSKPGELVTVLELSKGESRAVIENGILKYKDITVEYSAGKVNIK